MCLKEKKMSRFTRSSWVMKKHTVHLREHPAIQKDNYFGGNHIHISVWCNAWYNTERVLGSNGTHEENQLEIQLKLIKQTICRNLGIWKKKYLLIFQHSYKCLKLKATSIHALCFLFLSLNIVFMSHDFLWDFGSLLAHTEHCRGVQSSDILCVQCPVAL